MARVFISHASADLAVAVHVRLWLRDAGHEVFLDRDLAEGIQVGEEWKRRLYRELRAADAVVCVVTDPYRESEWCSAEVGIADVLGCPLLPVRAGAGAVSGLLDGLQYADAVADPARARAELTRRLELIDTAGGSAWPEDRSPYPGLQPFEPDMARVFRGRSIEVRQLLARLRSLGERARGGLVVVVGPSGCGKSSLVRAGLVPVVAADPAWEVAAPFTPGTEPLAALARALTITAQRAGMDWRLAATSYRLTAGDGLVGLAGELLIRGRRAPRERLLLVIDQGEELLTRAGPEGLARFCEVLGAGVAGPVRTVVTLRSEFLDRLRAVPELAALDIEPFPLRPLDGAMLRAVVEEPAAVAGLHIDGELVDRLMADTVGGEALPLLAFSLAELARGKTRGDDLTAAAYAELGGVQGSLARHADAALGKAVAASDLPPEAVLDGLTRLATLDETGQPTRRRLRVAGLEPALRTAFAVLVDHRLLVTTTEPDGTWIGVAHEALLRAWPPLSAAVDARRAALREVRIVENAAAEWDDARGRAGYLWDADRLAATQVALGATGDLDALSRHPDLDPVARSFLAASTEQARRTRTHTRRRRLSTVTTLSVLLVLSLVLGGLALGQASQEEQRADAAERTLLAQDLLTRADESRHEDRDFALRLGLGAYAVSRGDEAADASLVETLAKPHPISTTISGHGKSITAVAFSLDGDVLASGSEDHTVQIWDVADPMSPEPFDGLLPGPDEPITALAFSPDGVTLAAAAGDDVWRWDVRDPEHPAVLDPPLSGAGAVHSIAFSADGTLLAVAGDDGLALWDVTRPSDPASSSAGPMDSGGPVVSVAFSPRGPAVAYTSGDQAVHLWDVRADQPIGTPIGSHPGLRSVAFSHDGQTLGASAADGLHLWDVTVPANPHQLGSLRDEEIDAIAFASDDLTLLARSTTGVPRLVDLSDLHHPQAIDDGLTSDRGEVAMAPDGHTVAIGGADWKVQMWEIGDATRLRPLGTGIPGSADPGATADPREAARPGRLVAFANGDTLVSSDRDGVSVWNVRHPDGPEKVASRTNDPGSYHGAVGYSRERGTIAMLAADGSGAEMRAQFWDVTDELGPQTITPAIDGVEEPAILSPDGRILASGGQLGTELWDATARDHDQLGTLPKKSLFGATTALAFSSDSHLLVVGSKVPNGPARISLWDVTDPRDPSRLGDALTMEMGAVISAASLSPNGRTLAVSVVLLDGTTGVSLWDVAEPSNPRQVGIRLTTRPDSALTSLAFSPDSRTLAVGSVVLDDYHHETDDVTVWLWDVADPANPRPLGTPLTGNAGRITSLAFSPNGRMLAVGSAGRGPGNSVVVRLWDLGALVDLRHDVVQQACAEAGSLGEQEWELLVHGVPFSDPCAAPG